MNLPKSREIEDIRKSHFIVLGDTFRDINQTLEVLKQPSAGEGPKPSVYTFGNKKYIWFPHIAEEKDGKLIPHNSGWRNTLSLDFSELHQRETEHHEEINRIDFPDLSVERGIFVELPNRDTKENKYTFIGVYKLLPEKDLYGAQVYRRISDELYIDEWVEAKNKG